MSTNLNVICRKAAELPDIEKLALMDALLAQLDRPDPELDQSWPRRHEVAGKRTGRAVWIRQWMSEKMCPSHRCQRTRGTVTCGVKSFGSFKPFRSLGKQRTHWLLMPNLG